MNTDSRTSGAGTAGVSQRVSPLVAGGLVAITVLAALVRLRGLDAQGITLDESYSIYLARLPMPEFARTLWHSELNMALYYLLLRGWMHLGHSEWVIRLPGVMLSTATVLVVYWLGRRLFHPRTGLIAAALLALQPFNVLLAQNARSYPLAIFLVSLASLCFIRGLQNPTRLVWITYAVLSAMAVYSHFFAVLVIAAQLASLLFVGGKRIPQKQIWYAMTLLMALLVPWAIFMLRHGGSEHLSWVPPLSWQQLRWLLYSLTLSKARSLVYVALWCVGAWAALREWNAGKRWRWWFAFLWLAVPVLLAVAASARQALVVDRFLAVCVPASVLLAAVGVDFLASRSRLLGLAAFVVVVIYSVSGIRFNQRHEEFDEGWRQSSRYILQNVRSGDVVIAEGMKGLPFDYYRESCPESLPEFSRSDSLAQPLASPLPMNVWILGWTRSNGGAVASDDEAVRGFAEAHRHELCMVEPAREAGVTRMWHFAPCVAGLPEATK